MLKDLVEGFINRERAVCVFFCKYLHCIDLRGTVYERKIGWVDLNRRTY